MRNKQFLTGIILFLTPTRCVIDVNGPEPIEAAVDSLTPR